MATSKKYIAVCTELVNHTSPGVRYDKVRADVRLPNVKDTSGEEIVSFSNAVNAAVAWDSDTGHIALPRGAITVDKSKKDKPEGYMLLTQWLSCDDFPYVHASKCGKERPVEEVLPPLRIFQLISILCDPLYVLAAANDWTPLADVASGLSKDELAKVSKTAENYTVGEALKLLSCDNLITEGGKELCRVAAGVVVESEGMPSEETTVWFPNEDILQQAVLLLEKLAAETPQIRRGALAYLITPFTRQSIVSLHEAGVRPPIGIVRVWLAECKFVAGSRGKAIEEMNEADHSLTAFFMVPHAPQASYSTKDWWSNPAAHGRYIQASNIKDHRVRAPFCAFRRIPVAVEYYRVVDSAGKEEWFQQPEVPGDEWLSSILPQHTELGPVPPNFFVQIPSTK
jgi:hypothetical protein